MYQRLTFGEDAKVYIRLKISVQTSRLWRSLAQLPIERGQVFAYLPPSAPRNELPFLEWHIHSREDLEAQNIDREYTRRERDFLAQCLQQSQGFAFFYGTSVNPDGKIRQVHLEDVTTFLSPFPFSDRLDVEQPTDTYYVFNRDITRERLDYVLENAVERLPFIGALTSLPAQLQLPKNKIIDNRLLEELASRTEVIIIGAYGGDANLIWTRI